MKRLFLFILLINALNANGQGFCGVQTFLSDIVMNPISYTGGRANISKMSLDRNGNKYILGGFEGVMDIDPGPNVHSLTSVGAANMFLLKEDEAGNFIWARHFACLSPAAVSGINGSALSLDASGNIYIAGAGRDSVDIDPGPAINYLSTNSGHVGFILKLDSSGNFVWAKKYEGDSINHMNITGMKVVGNTIYVSAGFFGTVDFDPGPGSFSVSSTPGVGTDMALIRMDTAGNFIWGKTIGGVGFDYLNSLATDAASNLYITGGFQETVDFDPGPGVYALTATPRNPNTLLPTDIFVARYDSAGNFSWAHSYGNMYDDRGNAVAIDRFGSVIVTGYINDLVDFDPGPAVYSVGTSFDSEGFTLKLDNNGNLIWVKGRPAYPGATLITTDDTGNIFTAGDYAQVQKLDSSGNHVWGAGWGPSSISSGVWNVVRWIGLDNNDSIYLAGSFSGGGNDFDPCRSDHYVLPLPYTQSSGYILKLNQIACTVPIGIEHASLQTELKIYPNPSRGMVTFSSQLAIHRISVTDVTGKVVYTTEPNKAKIVVDLGEIRSGVYFYETDFGTETQRGKLVIY